MLSAVWTVHTVERPGCMETEECEDPVGFWPVIRFTVDILEGSGKETGSERR